MKPVIDQSLIAALEGSAPQTTQLRPVEDRTLIAALESGAGKTAPRSFMQEIGRQVGLTARAGIKGVTAIPTMVGDALGLNSSGAVDKTLGYILPSPKNATERVAGDIAGAMAGGGAISAGGRVLAQAPGAIARGVGDILASGTGMNVVSSGTGAGAAGVVRENGGGPGAQLAAGIAGSLAPTVAVGGGAAAIRGLARGGEEGRQRMVERVKTFEDAGIENPTVGQATGTRGAQATESVLSRMPASAGRMVARGEEEAAQMGAKVSGIADDLAKNTDATKAGLTIERGIKGFVKDFRATQDRLYNALDRYIAPDSRVDVTSTKAALESLNQPIPGAPETSKFFQNARIGGIQRAVVADTETPAGPLSQLGPIQRKLFEDLPPAQQTALANDMIDGKLPFEAVKKLRTLVGRELSEHNLASDVPRSKWKALYAALSKDMEGAAAAAGPEAERTLARANNYSSAGMSRIENVLDRVVGEGKAAEKIYGAAVGETKNGATTINAVMRSLAPAEQDVVRSEFIRRLGGATAGNQNAEGTAFSAKTFLTEWNKVDPAAKRTLFAGKDGQIAKDLDAVAKAAELIDKGSKVFANPSGTAQALTASHAGIGLAAAIGTGNAPVAAGIIGGLFAANGSARLMTNPDFVRWLAKSTTMPAGAIPGHIQALAQSAEKWDDADKAAAQSFIESVRKK